MVNIIRDAAVNRIHLTTGGGGAGIGGISAGTNLITSGTAIFSNSNGVTFGADTNGVITASVAPGAAGFYISGGTNSQNTGTVNFSNSNGISFGLNTNGVMTGSVRTDYAGTNAAITGGSITVNTSGISINLPAYLTTAARSQDSSNYAGTNLGITGASGTLNTSGFSISVTQSNQAFSAVGGSSAFQTLSFSNANGATFSNSNGQVQLSYTVPSIAGLISAVNLSAGTTSNNLTAFTLSNSNGLAFGLNGSVVTGSYTVPSTAGLISAINVSAGTTSNNLTAFTLSNSNGLAFGLNGSVVTGSYTVPTQTNQTLSFAATGNTTQNTTLTVDARSLVFNGLGGVTVGFSNGSIDISGATPTGGGGGVAISAGTNSTSTGTVVFSNSNGISFGMNTTGVVTASYTVPATAGLISNINLSAGTTSNNLTAFTLSNSNGLAFGLNGSVVTGSYTVPTVTNSSWTVSDNATSGTVARLAFTNLNGVTLSLSTGAGGSHTIVGSHNALTSQSNQNVTAANGGFAFQTLSFSNVNGFSFGTSAGSAITGSYTVPTQTNQTEGWFATGNTTQNTTATFDARSITLNGLGIITAGFSNGSIQLSATQSNQTEGWFAVGNTTGAASTATADARSLSIQGTGAVSVGFSNGSMVISGATVAAAPVNFSAGTTSGNIGSIVFSNSNGVSFGLNGSTITASAAGGGAFLAGLTNSGNTLGNTGVVGSQIVFVAPNNITLSGSTNGASATISILDPPCMSYYANGSAIQSNVSAGNNNTVSIQPFFVNYPLAFSQIMALYSNVGQQSAANNSSGYLDVSLSAVIYTMNGQTLSSVTSLGQTLTQSFSSNNTATVGGCLGLSATCNPTTLNPGLYWLAVHLSTNNTATGGVNTTALSNQIAGILAYTHSTAVTYQAWGQASAGSANIPVGLGLITTSGTVGTIALSRISCTGSRAYVAPVYFELRNSTFQ